MREALVDELVEFLRAQIAVDKAVARAAQAEAPTPWHDDGGTLYDAGRTTLAGYAGEAAAAHIARHDPARVLVECEAKRRIVGRLAAAQRYASTKGVTTEYAEGYDHGILDAARFLALSYADCPGYREEWKP